METIVVNCPKCGKKNPVTTENIEIHSAPSNKAVCLQVITNCPYCFSNFKVYETSINATKLFAEMKIFYNAKP